MSYHLDYDKSNNVNFLENLSEDEQHDLSYLLDQFIQWYENGYDEESSGECEFFGDSLRKLYDMANDLQYTKCAELAERENTADI